MALRDTFEGGYEQGRLFNPDNPPQAFSREEGDVELSKIRASMRATQMRRKGGPVKPFYLPKRLRSPAHHP